MTDRDPLVSGLAARYAEALWSQMNSPAEAGPALAFALGQEALGAGSTAAEIALIHHDALAEPHDAAALTRAAGFLAQALVPFDQALSIERQERRGAEEALWQAQRHQAVGRLASGVAHHFNNLLTAIIGNLELVRREHGENRSLARKLDRASEAARRAVKLTRQLLTFSGRQLVRPDLFEPSRGLADLVALLSGSLRGEIEVVTEVPEGLWAVRVDTGELELALLNLAINAGDAMGGRGRLSISAANCSVTDERLGLAGDYLVIEVADNGPGIPADILPRVFDPFFTTKAVGVGSGLGLSQVLGFAHQAKGAVDLGETPGGGATFRIFLPVARGAQPEPAPVRAQGATVLVVEDDADLAEITAAMLENLGFGVRLAYQAPAALELLRRGEAVDLVLCGATLGGGMGGLQLARRLRADHPGLPALLTCETHAISAAAELEGVPTLARPYRAGDLYRRVAGLLSGEAR